MARWPCSSRQRDASPQKHSPSKTIFLHCQKWEPQREPARKPHHVAERTGRAFIAESLPLHTLLSSRRIIALRKFTRSASYNREARAANIPPQTSRTSPGSLLSLPHLPLPNNHSKYILYGIYFRLLAPL